MKFYIEIGNDVDDGGISRRMKSWTGWEHADVVITVHTPRDDLRQSASGTQKSFSKALDWISGTIQELWPEDV